MSRLALASLSDLVTKDYFTAELSRELTRFATKEEMHAGFDKLWAAIDKQQESIDKLWQQREADRAEAAAQREADRAEAVARREADRVEAAAQREADRTEAVARREADRDAFIAETRRQNRWVIGTFIATTTLLVGVVAVVAAVLGAGA